jgi:hypothetical protein
MSSLKKVRINYCNAKLKERPSFGPVLVNEGNNPFALIGTMNGTLIRIPLIFGSSKEYRTEYMVTKLSDETTINLKELFLDQESASSVIGLDTFNNGALMVALLDGKIYEIYGEKIKLIIEFDSTLSSTPTIISNTEPERLLVPTTDGNLHVIDLLGNILETVKLDSPSTSKPLFLPNNNHILIGGKKGDVSCYLYNKDKLKKLWQFNAKKDITTQIISCNLMNDGRLFYLFGSADKNIYCHI